MLRLDLMEYRILILVEADVIVVAVVVMFDEDENTTGFEFFNELDINSTSINSFLTEFFTAGITQLNYLLPTITMNKYIDFIHE